MKLHSLPFMLYPILLGTFGVLLSASAGSYSVLSPESVYFQYIIHGIGGCIAYSLLRFLPLWQVFPLLILFTYALASLAKELWIPLMILGISFNTLILLYFEFIWKNLGTKTYFKVITLILFFILFELCKIIVLPYLPLNMKFLKFILVYRVIRYQFIQSFFTAIGLTVGLILSEEILEKFPEAKGRWKTKQN